jgi:mono/diheme cytochrome c family protein
LEDGRVTSRFWLVLVIGLVSLSGCGDAFSDVPIVYKDNERIATDLEKKPQLQALVRKTLADKFGPAPNRINVPPDSGFPDGGRRLGSLEKVGEKVERIVLTSTTTGKPTEVAGGYGLYRKYCLHCHGTQGGGDGATAPFLFPRPRDYRPGIFKFTSTAPSTPKPTREDLRRTIRKGLDGSSMPAFEALLEADEVEGLVDYVVFLSMRGELEKFLIDEAKIADKDDPEGIPSDMIEELTQGVVGKWKDLDQLVVNPTKRWSPPSQPSVLRGRDIYLGINTKGNKVGCIDCHGAHGLGDGSSFVDRAIYDKVAFRGKSLDVAIAERYKEVVDERKAASLKPGRLHTEPTAPAESFADYEKRMKTAWDPGSLDEWHNPLRPADLTKGVYKGGRRPIDLYWRIAKGINGVKMPAHSSLLPDEEIWDVVNFVLALGVEQEPVLLKDAEGLRRAFAAKVAAETSAVSTPAVASNPRTPSPPAP